MRTIETAIVVKPIRNSSCEVIHPVGDVVEIEHWNEVEGTCTVHDDDGVDSQTGISTEWLERVITNK